MQIDLDPQQIASWQGSELDEAKRTLEEKGWNYRDAAAEIGVTYQHLSYVLNGQRESRRVLRAIAGLPKRTKETERTKANEN